MDNYKRKFYHSLVIPTFFVFVIWFVKIIEILLNSNFSTLGIYPLKIEGLSGVFLAPLIHGDFNHLFANTMPLWVLLLGLFYFYSPISYKVLIFIYIVSGIWVWFSGRFAYHIGASGVIYGLAAFITISGIMRNHIRLMALALVVVFLYGGLIWGIFPGPPNISWESHLLGSIAGVIMAIYYRKTPVAEDMPLWVKFSDIPEDENDEEDNNDEKKTNNDYFGYTNNTHNLKN